MTTTSSFMPTVPAKGAASRSTTVSSWLTTVSFRASWRPWVACGHLTGRSLAQHDERLAFLDDVRGELRRVAAADVLRRMDRPGGDEQGLAGLIPTALFD